MINEFRDYIEQVIVGNDSQIPPSIKRTIDIVSTIAVSSAEAKRGFSLMNRTITKERNSLTGKATSDFMLSLLT